MTEPVPRVTAGHTVGPVDATAVPRYAGEATFARLPRLDQVLGGGEDVVGGTHGAAFLAARVDRIS